MVVCRPGEEEAVAHLLHIQSSPNLVGSITRRLSSTFVDLWCASHQGVEVEVLDLVADPPPHFGPELLGACYLPSARWTPEMVAARAVSDRLVDQLERADVLVIGSPMINYTISSQLKTWIDHVTVPGRTFEFIGPGRARGLLRDKQAFVIEARGNDYSTAPNDAFDHQESLIRHIFGFLGLDDVSFIRAEGFRRHPDQARAILHQAEQALTHLATCPT